jgi:K+-sensing histidine kinase KdpD
MNVFEYAGDPGIVNMLVCSNNELITFIIEDSGDGFTEEGLLHGTAQFYRGDKSKSSQMHFGLGLYIADTIVKKLNGAFYTLIDYHFLLDVQYVTMYRH